MRLLPEKDAKPLYIFQGKYTGNKSCPGNGVHYNVNVDN